MGLRIGKCVRGAAMIGVAMGLGLAARAQIGIYAMPVFTRVSNSTPDPGVYAFLGPNATSRMFTGVGFGVYDQLRHRGPIDLGFDVRASIQKGSNAHLNEFLVGGRAQYHVPGSHLKPYAEVLGGVGSSQAATNPVDINRGTFGGFVGLDYQVGKYVDVRAIEVGYSSLATVSTDAVTGTTAQLPSSSLIHFSAGVVFRLPQRANP